MNFINLFVLTITRVLISSKEEELETPTRRTLEAPISTSTFSSSSSDSLPEELIPVSAKPFLEDSSLQELTDHQCQCPKLFNFLKESK